MKKRITKGSYNNLRHRR